MIGSLLGLVSAGGSKLWLWIAAGTLILAMALAIWIQTLRLDVAKADLALAEHDRDVALDAAAKNLQAANEIAAHAQQVQQVMGQQMAEAQARADDLATLLQEIADAEDSRQCAGSEPIRRLLERMRQSP